MKKILVHGCLWFFVVGCLSCNSIQEPLKVLVVTGTHEYNNAAFDAMIESFDGMDCTIEEMDAQPDSLFEKVGDFPYDAIVMYNYRQSLTPEHQQNLVEILNSGVGLTVLHHGIAGFPGWLDYENIIGATYVLEEQTRGTKHYPRPTWKHGVEMNIKVEDPGHPITKGVSDFTVLDETYKSWVYHDGNHLLLSTENDLSNTQIAWTRTTGDTRVFYMQLGHDEQTFESEHYRRLLKQGIEWTEKVKK